MESLQRNFCGKMKQPTILDLTAAASQTNYIINNLTNIGLFVNDGFIWIMCSCNSKGQ